MDAIGLQNSLISALASSPNAEVCAFSGYLFTTNLSTSPTEVARYITSKPIRILASIVFQTNNGYHIDATIPQGTISLYSVTGYKDPVTTIAYHHDAQSKYANLQLVIDGESIIIRAYQTGDGNGSSFSYYVVFIAFH